MRGVCVGGVRLLCTLRAAHPGLARPMLPQAEGQGLEAAWREQWGLTLEPRGAPMGRGVQSLTESTPSHAALNGQVPLSCCSPPGGAQSSPPSPSPPSMGGCVNCCGGVSPTQTHPLSSTPRCSQLRCRLQQPNPCPICPPGSLQGQLQRRGPCGGPAPPRRQYRARSRGMEDALWRVARPCGTAAFALARRDARKEPAVRR